MVVLGGLATGLARARFLAPQLKADPNRGSCHGHRYRPEDGDDEKNRVSSWAMTPPALAATIIEGTPVTKTPIATPGVASGGYLTVLAAQAARGTPVRGVRRHVR